MAYSTKDLALNGGPKARTSENPPMFPGALEIGEEEKKEVLEVLDRKYLFRYYGPKDYPSKVKALEDGYAAFLGAKHCLALNSCTSALISALVALGIGPGDEVIVPAYTFFATCAAVVAARAIPIVAEVDKSLTMDPEDFERKITPRDPGGHPGAHAGYPGKDRPDRRDRSKARGQRGGGRGPGQRRDLPWKTTRFVRRRRLFLPPSSTRSSPRAKEACLRPTRISSIRGPRPITTSRPAGARTASPHRSSRGRSSSG